MFTLSTPHAVIIGWLGESVILGYAALCFHHWIEFKMVDAIWISLIGAIMIWHAIRVINPLYVRTIEDKIIYKVKI
jgi:hypothetical protein